MGATSRILVRMKFLNEYKVTEAMRQDEQRFSYMADFEKLFFESFPKSKERCQNLQLPSSQLELQYEDEDGERLSINNDGDLKDAIDWDRGTSFKFRITYKNPEVDGPLPTLPGGISSPSTSSRQETPVNVRNKGAEYLAIPVLPSQEELLQSGLPSHLPVNQVGMKYSNVSDYLGTHFRLLREDYIHSLRQGIQSFRKQLMSREVWVYHEARFVTYDCGWDGVDCVMSFPFRRKAVGSESDELKYGALLCISADGFQKSYHFGVVRKCSRKIKGASKVWVRALGTWSERFDFDSKKTYVMVESTTAFFEAYHHVLKALQREEMKTVPFLKYLVHLERHIDPPSYLLGSPDMDRFDFQSVFPELTTHFGTSIIHTLQKWPQLCTRLDAAQWQALEHGLTKELSIIQGPPGTGKTFIGLLIVRLMLANLPLRGSAGTENGARREGPILVICKTNHALDQFLEGIKKFENELIRIGGRSKSEVLKFQNLKYLLRKRQVRRNIDPILRRTRSAFNMEKAVIKYKINDTKRALNHLRNSKYVGKEQLQGIALEQQVKSLFPRGYDHKKSVQDWLEGAFCPLNRSERRNVPVDDTRREHRDRFRSQISPEKGEELVLEAEDKDRTPYPRQVKSTRSSRSKIVMQESALTVLTRNMANMNLAAERAVHPEDDVVEGKGDDHVSCNVECAAGLPSDVHVDNDSDDARDELRGDLQEGAHDNEPQLADFKDIHNVWVLPVQQRRVLHDHWIESTNLKIQKQIQGLAQHYEGVCEKLCELKMEIKLSILRKANVVGFTTTGAARDRDLLKSLNSEIVIVEEAAEVFEAGVLACVTSAVKHLVLIGDHMQLRPSTAVYKLSTENRLDLSMFERLVRGGVEHVTLREQRRMRPSFSKLVKSLYPTLKDHESVSQYEHVRGLGSDLWFFDHTAKEQEQTLTSSRVNATEARLVVELTIYLMKQECYSASEITILSMYAAQISEIDKLLKERVAKRFSVKKKSRPRGKMKEQEDGKADRIRSTDGDVLIPQVRSVDGFQGEESDIIILSLVRSNNVRSAEGEGTIGFLRTSNRVCVALTRARKGLYIFGNAALLAARSTLWREMIDGMRADGVLGSELELVCQNHPDTKTVVAKKADFKQVRDGGCSRPCATLLDCAHPCPRLCHPGSHEHVICPRPCPIAREACDHDCALRCHHGDPCPPCPVTVVKTLPTCGHSQLMPCHRDPTVEICRTPCAKVLTCGHQCDCGSPCTVDCAVPVERTLPTCGHSQRMPCHRNPTVEICRTPCAKVLTCGHKCDLECGSPCTVDCAVPVERTLPTCGHSQRMPCHRDPTVEICRRECSKVLSQDRQDS
ncbi:hypothetical protein MPTK1_5g14410 [Marchantia polymorpha subsp. ruderalis]|uniref:NF-X1-type domain-containing protein n=2 Tax=Marchantia polymorpha TaxID=3197 RepID=A0AAF6BIB8_MARPO|nr:hypothetical protein MARPO_0032s0134 [Marchantia polymorpha]BBN11752.1 hypothetical protein Mp_5g14410 [Marchantia polymorpha subsp. ruderalis]|eukprot:PTQ41970.1 hypothetical protein MARPO_0032s0134 [Marchantia polymorpha]